MVKGIADIPVKFFCRQCGKRVKAMGSSYHKTERGIRFSAVRRHSWNKHPELWMESVASKSSSKDLNKSKQFKHKRGVKKIARYRPPKGVIPPQFLKHPPPTWRGKVISGKRLKRRKGGNPLPRRYKRKAKAFGTVSWKGLLAGIASLSLIRLAVNRFLPGIPGEYVDSMALVGAGLAGAGVKRLGTKNLLIPGVILGISKFVEDAFRPNGLYTFPTIGAPQMRGDVYG